MKHELTGVIRAVDLDRLTAMVVPPESKERVEVVFPARCTAYFLHSLNYPVRLHGEWIDGGIFNVVRWMEQP
jgi:hypothetical protein